MADSSIENAIAAAALSPLEAAGDGGSVKARSIDEMIKADQYAKGLTAAETVNPWGALRFARVIPPGSA